MTQESFSKTMKSYEVCRWVVHLSELTETGMLNNHIVSFLSQEGSGSERRGMGSAFHMLSQGYWGASNPYWPYGHYGQGDNPITVLQILFTLLRLLSRTRGLTAFGRSIILYFSEGLNLSVIVSKVYPVKLGIRMGCVII